MLYYPRQKLDAMTREIIGMMPSLEPFFSGEKTIDEYSIQLSDYQADPVHLQRQLVFKNLINKKIKEIFSVQETEQLHLPTEDGTSLSGGVVDHHGIINNPVLIGSNIVPHYHTLLDRKGAGDILTFATGNNPLGNFFHKRGFQFHGRKYSIFPKADKDKIVYGLPVQEFCIKTRLLRNKQWHDLDESEQSTIESIDAIISNIDFSKCQNFGDQLTKINYYLWPRLFEKNYRHKIQALVSMEYDDVVNDFLVHVLKNEKDSFITRMILDPDTRARALKYFSGSTGAWNEERETGTHFFWLRNSANERESLVMRENGLTKKNGETVVRFNLSELADAIGEKRIYVNMLVKFSLLLFYAGLKPFAGYGSSYYLWMMQKKIVDFITEEFPDDARRAKLIPVNNLTSVPVLIKRDSSGHARDYFAFDIIADGGITLDYFKKMAAIPIKYFMAPNLQNIYDYAFNLYGKGEKKQFDLCPEDYTDLFNPLFD